MFSGPEERGTAEESSSRIRIRHYGAKVTGGGEIIGAVLENGSLRFGSVEIEPIEALRPWMEELVSGKPADWPPFS